MKRLFILVVATQFGFLALAGAFGYYTIHTQAVTDMRIAGLAAAVDNVSEVAVQARDGVNGKNGESGNVGPAGTPGQNGLTVVGPSGNAGLQGAIGETGAQGLQGDQGPQGDQGAPGAGLESRCNQVGTNYYMEERQEGSFTWIRKYKVPNCDTN